MLQTLHGHARDAFLQFEPLAHVYTVLNDARPYTSVTKWVHSHFAAFEAPRVIQGMMRGKNWLQSPYFGQTPEEIEAGWLLKGQQASAAGTALHARIENYYNQVPMNPVPMNPVPMNPVPMNPVPMNPVPMAEALEEDKAWLHFQNFLTTVTHLKPYRTEWMIFHEATQLAGSIDMVYEQADGTLLIYDWKRVKELKKVAAFGVSAITPCLQHLPDTNYWHYALQLNTYKMILEASYGKTVVGLYLVLLHPDLSNFQVCKVPFLSQELTDVFT